MLALDGNLLAPKRRRLLKCPGCGSDLRLDEVIRSPDQCPFCREQIGVSFWYRLGIVLLGLFLDLLTLGALRLRGLILVVSFALLVYPATVLAYGLLLKLMPPILQRRHPTVTTLFKR